MLDPLLAAHALTAVRLPIAIALTQTWGERGLSAALVALAALTDTLDGTVARWAHRRNAAAGRVTKLDVGGWLDPVIDKLFVLIVLGLIASHIDWRSAGSAWLLVAIAAREIALVPVSIVWALQGKSMRGRKARPIGKVATIVQFVACAVAVVDLAWAGPFAILCAGVGLAAVVDYLIAEQRE